MAELGIVDPVSIATATERHAEMIEAYKQGKITSAALKHSLAPRPDREDDDSKVVDHTSRQ
jgi:hypothetical protein